MNEQGKVCLQGSGAGKWRDGPQSTKAALRALFVKQTIGWEDRWSVDDSGGGKRAEKAGG